MSNMEEEKGIVAQNVGECNCNQNVERRNYMPQFAPQQGGRKQYGMSGNRPQHTPQFDGRMPVRPPVFPARGRGEADDCAHEHNHNVNGKKLLSIIDKASFAMDDTRLFLDTHPDCKEAVAYFKKMEKIRNEAIKEYEIHCGPILSYHTSDAGDGSWNWNEGPLPWNNDCCDGRRM